LTTLDNPNGQWMGPETVSAALGQQSSLPNDRWLRGSCVWRCYLER
jgi:hypothetical protein